MRDAPVEHEVEQRHRGLPPDQQSTSLLGREGIGAATEALWLGPARCCSTWPGARAGFDDVEVEERPEWRAREPAMWAEAAALDPGDSEALWSPPEEGRRVLSREYDGRLVPASVTAPG